MERSRRSNPSAKPRTSLLLLNVEIGNKNNQFAKFKFLVTIFHSNFWFTFQFRIWMMKVWYCVEQHFPKSQSCFGAAAACFHRKVSHAVVFVVVRGAASKLSFSRLRQSYDQFALELQRMRKAFSEFYQDFSLVWWNSKQSKLRELPLLTSSPKCWLRGKSEFIHSSE